ncbi:MAG: PAS domain-containing sensor histidine kinase [Variovorax sp.]|nr:MAG: PAS domain-containing sensor histidine kinase [Variovorax sp.]
MTPSADHTPPGADTRPPLDQQSQHMLRTMVEGVRTGVVISSDESVIYANPEFMRLLDYGPDDNLEGTPVLDLIADSDRLLAQQRRKVVAAGRPVPTGWVKLKAKGGARVQMMLNESQVFWNGKPHFITAANRASDQDLLDIQVRKTRASYEKLLVTELERQQAAIARELHDSLGSELAGMSLMLGGIKAMRPEDPVLAMRLDQVQGQLQTAIEMTRGLAHGLMPVDHHAGAFWRALERLASDWTLLKGVPCEFSMAGPFDHVAAETGTHLYRIAQEAIANALRHGQATSLRLKLTENAPDLVLEIEDNGSGFKAGIINAVHGSGLGVRSMMARAKAIGGRIELTAARPVGTCIRVTWPAGPHRHPQAPSR